MPQITIYTMPLCGYCHRAKHLLTTKGADFTEIDLSTQPEKRAEMLARAPDARTVPQIFIGDNYVGGSDDLAALEQAGKLDAMLAV